MQSKTENKKKVWLIPVCILLAAALIALIVFADSAEEKARITKTLNTFYNAFYVDSNYEEAKSCLAADVRGDFETVMCMGSDTPTTFNGYRGDAVMELGSETFTVDVRMTNIEECIVEELMALQRTYAGTKKAVITNYEIVFTLESGEEKVYNNELFLVYKDGGWFMTTHLSLPIGANMYVTHESASVG